MSDSTKLPAVAMSHLKKGNNC